MKGVKKKKKKPGASTVSHGWPGLCQIYLTGSWRGNWLLAGSCFTYLHIALLPELDRLMISSYVWTLYSMWSSLQYISSVQPDFQSGFTGAVTRQGGDFLQLATIGILHIYSMLSAARFSDELGMQTGAHPYTSFTYSSVRPDFQTGLFPEPLRGYGNYGTRSWKCFGINDHWRLTCRSLPLSTSVFGEFVWSFDLKWDTLPDLWRRLVGAPRTLLWGSLAKRGCNEG